MVEITEVDKEIRHMPPSHVLELSSILDHGEGWKSLMSKIRNGDNPEEFKYNMEHIRLVENAGERQRRSCTEILFEEWGTSGINRPKYSSLLKYLVETEQYRAAEYVHTNLLEMVDHLERPCSGPAAKVQIPVITHGNCNVNSDEVTLVNNYPSAPPASFSDSEPKVVVDETMPVSKLSGYPREFKFDDLKVWSKNFSKRLGHGAFGSVYLCEIPESMNKVAVKRLQLNNSVAPIAQLPNQFHNEISTLTLFNHRNVLTLLGYCCDGPDLCLIYDYMVNGSLEDKLKEGSRSLEWKIRFDISRGTAEGIYYLHSHAEKPHIHRDVKSANILLDQDLTPKLGDFGLARPAPMETVATSTIVGTTAYMSPEALRGDVSVKMDVFSFGVVLLELVTGLLAWDEKRETYSLVSYIDDFDNISCLIDQRPEKPNDDLAMEIFKVSQECLHEKKQHRPYMEQILKMLNDITIQMFTDLPG